MKKNKILRVVVKIIIIISLFYWLWYFQLQNISLIGTDLGRFIRSGAIISQDSGVLYTNYFSFAEGDYSIINHHWGSSVVFYTIWTWFGFSGLSVLYLGLNMLSIIVLMRLSAKASNFWIAALAVFITIPLIGHRTEVRPEVFSLLFISICVYVLYYCYHNYYKPRVLWLLPLVMVLWVNMHLYFFIGFGLIGVFALVATLRKHSLYKLLWLQLGVSLLLAGLLNPFGVSLLLQPFLIFQDYGYTIAETRPPWSFMHLFPATRAAFIWMCSIGSIVLLGFIALFRWKRRSIDWILFFIFIASAVGALAVARNVSMFGLLLIPVISHVLYELCNLYTSETARMWLPVTFISFFLVSGLSILFIHASVLQQLAPRRSLGLFDQSKTAYFLNRNAIPGPLLNNLDSGSYFIFYSNQPKSTVFVDSRPEAYPGAFFRQDYSPLFKSEEEWRRVLGKYQFNSIAFGWSFLDEDSKNFLMRRSRDPEWAIIVSNPDFIVFMRRSPATESVFKRVPVIPGALYSK